jgi:hypothetical protein
MRYKQQKNEIGYAQQIFKFEFLNSTFGGSPAGDHIHRIDNETDTWAKNEVN